MPGLPPTLAVELSGVLDVVGRYDQPRGRWAALSQVAVAVDLEQPPRIITSEGIPIVLGGVAAALEVHDGQGVAYLIGWPVGSYQ